MNDLKVVAGDEGFQKADKGRKADGQRERQIQESNRTSHSNPTKG